MTERLYYSDSYTTDFSARVIERTIYNELPALVLDRSCFYPTSGGQPFDLGTINGIDVVDVAVRDSDDAVLHVLAEAPAEDAVQGKIDWQRRFDHMQQHTGQHILTQAFIEVAGANTVSFHLGTESVTIDLDRVGLPATAIARVEDLANQIVTRNLTVRAWYPTAEELADLPLRKVPDVNGKLRVVGIGDVDFTACGGTHVARTGEVGQIKIIRTEKYKDMTRVEFLCGMRALQDYREKNAILHDLSASLTVGYWEISEAIDRLRAENKQIRSELRAAQQSLLLAEAKELLAESPAPRIIRRTWVDRNPGDLRALASRLIEAPGTAVLLGLAGEKSQIILARSAELDQCDMVQYLRQVMGILTGETDSRRGGGRPDFAQGGGVSADEAALAAALEQVAQALETCMNKGG